MALPMSSHILPPCVLTLDAAYTRSAGHKSGVCMHLSGALPATITLSVAHNMAEPTGAACRFRVLDECDEMLNMGFVDDVERILSAGGAGDVQTLLWSATLPAWVKDITKRFLKPTHKTIDLVGNDRMKVCLPVAQLPLMLQAHA